MQSQLKSQQTSFSEIEKLTLKNSYGDSKDLEESKQDLKRRKNMED